MRHFFRAVAAIGIWCLPQPSTAQDPRGIIDFFARELQRQQYLQQQQQYQQQMLQQQQQLYNEFLSQWNACFNNDVQACDQALYYPGLNQNDRNRLLQKRQSIVAAQEHEERQRIETERQRTAEAERQRAAEVERVRRQREDEERRVAALRAFNFALDGCRRYVASSCDAALASRLATTQDRASIANWRAVAEKFQIDQTACQGRSATACDSALASPAANASDRTTLERWRAEASPLNRVRALAVEFSATTVGTAQSLANTFRELPASTQITGAIALLLAAALGLAILPRRTANQARLRVRNGDDDPSLAFPEPTREPDRTRTMIEAPRQQATATGMDEPLAMAAVAPVAAQASDGLPHHMAVHVEQTDERSAARPEPSWTKEVVTQGAANYHRTRDVNPSATYGVSVGSAFGNPALFAILYILLMIPTYWLPYMGSNSAALNATGSAAGVGMNPAFWPHLGALALLVGVAWMRGKPIGKTWLVIFPILALVFDLTPGLNFIPLVPTVMHLMAIILGVSGGSAPELTQMAAPGGR